MFTQDRPLQLFVALLFAGLIVSPPVNGQTPITGETERCTGGEAAGQYPCKNVDLKSYLSIDRLGGTGQVALNDIWGWTDPETGTEYALVGRTDGVAFVDVSDPTDPIYVGELPSLVGASPWRDVKVYQDHAYVVSEASIRNGPNHGIQVFDLTQLRSVSNPPVTFSETAHYDRFGTAHNIVINQESGYAYVVGITSGQDVPPSADCGAGLHVVDINTPDQPEFKGCHTDFTTGGQVAQGYTHDAQCVAYEGPDSEYQGREVCFNANENELNIADVTDKSSPETITNATYPKPGYVHQAWLTEDHRYLLVDDETDEQSGFVDQTRTLVFDVSDLDTPELVTSFSGQTSSSDHNQYVAGRYTFQANYRSGLRILDVTDPANPSETAYFDTHPSSNSAGFEGAWSTYPFFESGIVLVSSIGEGLFVLQPRLAPIFSFEASVEETRAAIRWRLSATANTAETVVEQLSPEASEWKSIETVVGKSVDGRQSFTYETADLQPGIHQFRVRHVAVEGEETMSQSVRVQVPFQEADVLEGLPNPIQGRRQFTLKVRDAQEVRVDLYDVLGRRISTLFEGKVEAAARQKLTINTQASGLYFLRVQGDSVQHTRKVVFTR